MLWGAIRAHRSIIEQIAGIYGDQLFTSQDLRQHGIPEAFIKRIRYFHGARVLKKIAVNPASKVATWQLTDVARAYLERTREVRHECKK